MTSEGGDLKGKLKGGVLVNAYSHDRTLKEQSNEILELTTL